ncbi:MAG: hypothetical protein ACOX4U_00845 [Anaerovoracaceae bacterium]|jgi:hypothetical protein
MKRIMFQIKILSVSCLMATLCVFMLIYLLAYEGYWELTAMVLAASVIDICFIRLFCRYVHDIGRAKLIVDNPLFHLTSAETHNNDKVDIYLSSFGMLLCDKVVFFEPEKEILGAVIYNGGMLTVVYGKSGVGKEVKILGFILSESEMKEFGERLRYETGVCLMQ